MPFVNVRTAKGMLSQGQKQELQERLNDLMVEIEGDGDPAMRENIWILIEETQPEDWSIGGVSLTPEIIQEIKSKQLLRKKNKS